jgi:hypothetical protein
MIKKSFTASPQTVITENLDASLLKLEKDFLRVSLIIKQQVEAIRKTKDLLKEAKTDEEFKAAYAVFEKQIYWYDDAFGNLTLHHIPDELREAHGAFLDYIGQNK